MCFRVSSDCEFIHVLLTLRQKTTGDIASLCNTDRPRFMKDAGNSSQKDRREHCTSPQWQC